MRTNIFIITLIILGVFSAYIIDAILNEKPVLRVINKYIEECSVECCLDNIQKNRDLAQKPCLLEQNRAPIINNISGGMYNG